MEKRVWERRMTNVLVESYEVCDKCQERIPTTNIYEVNDFKLSHRVGSSYPDAGYAEVSYVDLCPGCATELFQLLEINGYRVNVKDEEY